MTGKEERTDGFPDSKQRDFHWRMRTRSNKILILEISKLTSQGEIMIEFVKMKKGPITERLDQANEPHQ